ncbi:MAG: 2-oxoacid:acceptor oxidoreductase family protein [Candidatus Fermentibacteraceae bacterium]|nr:2-oxoacid:acceptor oxidoreductase family protein [Candidatus Fermentibacteraceae bacterium]MBN2609146.1 2-oxoacid:acceptor oxidoreductase family protein [Candidatus Fermentibacteraceae bacterium]
MKKYYEVRLSGAGGQGLGLAGRVFSEASIQSDYNVCQTQSYGPEARGGASRTDIIISRKEILYPNCRHLDILLAMNQESSDKFAGEVEEDGIILVDSTFVNQLPQGRVYGFPLTTISVQEFKTPLAANIIAIGMLASIGRLFSIDTWVRAIEKTVPARFAKMNLNAFEIGHREGREILHVEEGRVPVAYDRKQPVPDSLKKETKER